VLRFFFRKLDLFYCFASCVRRSLSERVIYYFLLSNYGKITENENCDVSGCQRLAFVISSAHKGWLSASWKMFQWRHNWWRCDVTSIFASAKARPWRHQLNVTSRDERAAKQHGKACIVCVWLGGRGKTEVLRRAVVADCCRGRCRGAHCSGRTRPIPAPTTHQASTTGQTTDYSVNCCDQALRTSGRSQTPGASIPRL